MTPELDAKDEAIRRAAESTQPELALAIDGWYIVSGETLARHEYNTGELIQLRALRAQGDSASSVEREAQATIDPLIIEAGRYQRDSATTEGAVRAALREMTLAYHSFNGRCTTDLPSCQSALCVMGKRALLADVPDETDSGLDEFGNPAGFTASGTGAGESQ